MGVPIASVPAVISVLLSTTLMQDVLPWTEKSSPATTRSEPVLYAKAETIAYTAQLPEFVTRSGSSLMLQGKPYRFVGLNIYNANNQGSCWYSLGTPATINDTLTEIGPSQTVFRAWFFQPMAIRNGQLDWSAFDATLAAARTHDERVIATLGNQYPDCDHTATGNRTEAWYRNSYATAADAGMLYTYRDWVTQVVSRYRNDPTVLAWQLMNEAADPAANGRCSATASQTLKTFAQNVAGVIKGIDANHLVSLGTMGVRECGTIGAQYQDVHNVTGIDLCEVHDYGTPPAGLGSTLQLRIQQCRALNKPLFIGEMGVLGRGATRASILRGKLATALRAGVSGVLVWDWANDGQIPYSGYEVQPGDPALTVLAAAL